MRRRRSVRHFSREPVALELIENALKTAATTPNQQPANCRKPTRGFEPRTPSLRVTDIRRRESPAVAQSQ
jgi:nitroreductase